MSSPYSFKPGGALKLKGEKPKFVLTSPNLYPGNENLALRTLYGRRREGGCAIRPQETVIL